VPTICDCEMPSAIKRMAKKTCRGTTELLGDCSGMCMQSNTAVACHACRLLSQVHTFNTSLNDMSPLAISLPPVLQVLMMLCISASFVWSQPKLLLSMDIQEVGFDNALADALTIPKRQCVTATHCGVLSGVRCSVFGVRQQKFQMLSGQHCK
jgi:hypothetical protein